jgi:hypothetical protein
VCENKNVMHHLQEGMSLGRIVCGKSCRSEIEGMMAIVVKGDAMSTDDLEKVFDSIEDVDAVITTIGGTPADHSSDSQVGCSDSNARKSHIGLCHRNTNYIPSSSRIYHFPSGTSNS